MDHGRYPIQPSPLQRDVAGETANRKVILRAVQLIMADEGITEMCAYSVLVHAAVDAGTTVRETASRILAAA